MSKYLNKESLFSYEFVRKKLNVLTHIMQCDKAVAAAQLDVCNKQKTLQELLEKVITVGQMLTDYLCWYMRYCNNHSPEALDDINEEILSLDAPLEEFHSKTVPVSNSLKDYIEKLIAHQAAIEVALEEAKSAKSVEDLPDFKMDIADAFGFCGPDVKDLEKEWDALRLHRRLHLLLVELKRKLWSNVETEE